MFKKWFMAVLQDIKAIATIEASVIDCLGSDPLDPEEFKTSYKQTYTREQKSVLRRLDYADVFGEKGNLSRVFEDLDSMGDLNNIKFSVM